MGSKKIVFRQSQEQVEKEMTRSDVIKRQMLDISFNDVNKTSNNFIDIKLLTPEQTIQQSLVNLLKLPEGGNVLFPETGEEVSKMLFNNTLNRSEAEQYVKAYIESNEPRITINSVSARKTVDDYNEATIIIDVSYLYKNSNDIYSATLSLKET